VKAEEMVETPAADRDDLVGEEGRLLEVDRDGPDMCGAERVLPKSSATGRDEPDIEVFGLGL
jgi:hypothetical protein